MASSPIINETELLAKIQLFLGVSMESIQGCLSNCSEKIIQEGKVLLSPKKENRNIYILLEGVLGIYLESLDDPPLNIIRVGECVGEMSIIDDTVPSAYVVAEERCRLLVLPRDIAWDMVNASHRVAKNLLHVLTRRLRYDHGVINEGAKLQKQLKHHAIIDGLTGIHNRRWFNDAFGRKIKRSLSAGMKLCFLVIDIDHFKSFNDQFGHLAGDRVICSVAETLMDNMRPNDMLARFGGDEFVVVLPETDKPEAMGIAERIRKEVEDLSVNYGLSRELPSVTTTIGLACLDDKDDADSLFERADKALYQAKAQGRNCVVCL